MFRGDAFPGSFRLLFCLKHGNTETVRNTRKHSETNTKTRKRSKTLGNAPKPKLLKLGKARKHSETLENTFANSAAGYVDFSGESSSNLVFGMGSFP